LAASRESNAVPVGNMDGFDRHNQSAAELSLDAYRVIRARARRDCCKLLFGLTMLFATGCHRGLIYTPTQLPPEFLAHQVHSAQRLNLTRFARTGTNSQQISAGDQLQVAITTGLESDDQAEWPPIRVDDQGSVDLPLVGAVEIAGLDLAAAEQRIRDESVRRAIYRAPNVSVSLVKRRTNRVTVVGAVVEGGVRELPAADCDLFAAIVAAGGLSDDASTVVEIRHPSVSPPETSLASFPLTGPPVPNASLERIDLVELERAESDAQLEDGAVVMVLPQAPRTIQVIGLVNKPSQIEMPADQDVRMLDAIAQAGGLTLQIANKVHVIRQVPGRDAPVVIETTIRDAKSQAHANILLAAGDVVSVEETPSTFTVEMLRSFIRFGFTSSIPGF
jgi:polysaccharide export outer membrane protein